MEDSDSLSQVYNMEELGVLRQKYHHFTQQEMEMALEEAREEVSRELGQYKVIETKMSVSKPTSKTRPQTVNNPTSIRDNKPERVSKPVCKCSTLPKSPSLSRPAYHDSNEYSNDTEDTSNDSRDSSENGSVSEAITNTDVSSNSVVNQNKNNSKNEKSIRPNFVPRPLFTSPPAKPHPRPSPSKLNGKSNSPPTSLCSSKTSPQARVTHCVGQMEVIFSDIFTAEDVKQSVPPPQDILEEEKVTRRVKEFTCRFGRSLYQAKQVCSSLTSQVNKARMSGTNSSCLQTKLVQLLNSCRQLLLSYRHFLPLSGGHLFPLIVTDALEVVVDTAGLAADLGLNTGSLSSNIRRLEQLLGSRPGDSLDLGRLGLINSLAKSLLGDPGREVTPSGQGVGRGAHTGQRGQRSPSKVGRGSTIPRPRGTRLLQARTNMARLKRMQGAEQDRERELISVKGEQDAALISARGEYSLDFLLADQESQLRGENTNLRGISGETSVRSSKQAIGRSSKQGVQSRAETVGKTDNRVSGDEGNQSMDEINAPDHNQSKSPDPRLIMSPDLSIKPARSSDLKSAKQLSLRSLDMTRVQSSDLTRVQSPDLTRVQSPDLGKILKRIHNLELLATRPETTENPTESQEQHPVKAIPTSKGTMTGNLGNTRGDLGHLLNRLEIIHSDFDLVSSKYEGGRGANRLMRGWRDAPCHGMEPERGSRTRDVADHRTEDSPIQPPKQSLLGLVSTSMVEDVVSRVSRDLLQEDLLVDLVG